MKILGISFNRMHDSGAALIEDGVLKAVVNEERLTRVKVEGRFPALSIQKVLEISGTKPEEIDAIAYSGSDGHSFERFAKEEFLCNKSAAHWLKICASMALKAPQLRAQAMSGIKSELKKIGIAEKPVTYVDHHASHAFAAYFASGFEQATVVTVDAGGDKLSSTIFRAEHGKLEPVAESLACDSFGSIWARLIAVYGFKPATEAGKFMGLAGYSQKKDLSAETGILEKHVFLDESGLRFVKPEGRKQLYHARFEPEAMYYKKLFETFRTEDVAAALQRFTEKIISKLVSNAVKKTGISDVCLCGGVFANVRANQRIYETGGIGKMFVYPNMSDAGLGEGAALKVWAESMTEHGEEPKPHAIKDMYLGPGYSEKEIENAINGFGLSGRAEKARDVEKEIAGLLLENKVIARFNGRMEAGPRALGNRSILYQPKDPTTKDWLNERLSRTEFMPFAPVTMREFAEECYRGFDWEKCIPARFMIVSLDCTDRMKKDMAGVVHVDGTARPQIIDKNANPSYYKILEEFKKLSGLPSIINTSFNMHGEPIVCSPEDAIRSYLQGGEDCLAIGNWIVK